MWMRCSSIWSWRVLWHIRSFKGNDQNSVSLNCSAGYDVDVSGHSVHDMMLTWCGVWWHLMAYVLNNNCTLTSSICFKESQVWVCSEKMARVHFIGTQTSCAWKRWKLPTVTLRWQSVCSVICCPSSFRLDVLTAIQVSWFKSGSGNPFPGCFEGSYVLCHKIPTGVNKVRNFRCASECKTLVQSL
jgi:hypothetical protein